MSKRVFIILFIIIISAFFIMQNFNEPMSSQKVSTPEHQEQASKLEARLVGARACSSCHLSISAEVQKSIHGRSGLSCIACHTFREDNFSDPDRYLKESFYKQVKITTCKRCHSTQVKEWRTGIHVNPLDNLYARLFSRTDRELSRISLISFATKRNNACLNCHPPHSTKK